MSELTLDRLMEVNKKILDENRAPVVELTDGQAEWLSKARQDGKLYKSGDKFYLANYLSELGLDDGCGVLANDILSEQAKLNCKAVDELERAVLLGLDKE